MEQVSLLDVAKYLKKEKVGRLLTACSIQIDEAHKQSLSEYVQEWVNEKEKNKVEITGMLLQVSNFALNLIEAEPSILYQHLKYLESCQFIQRANVIMLTEDVPARLYQMWVPIPMHISLGGEEDQETPLLDRATKVYKDMCQVSRVINPLQNRKSAIASIMKQNALEYIPNADTFQVLTSDKFPSITEYFQQFFEPQEYVLDGELIWPVAPSLIY